MPRSLLKSFAVVFLSTAVAIGDGQPTTVRFPAKRGFQHDFEIITKADGNTVAHQLVAAADHGKIHFVVELYVKDFLKNGTPPTFLDRGAFSFNGQRDNGQRLDPATIIVRVDGKTVSLNCKRKDGLLRATFNLEEFSRFLSAETISIKIADLEFDLNKTHIEAMCDLASRVPDGKTVDGRFQVEHEADAVTVSGTAENGIKKLLSAELNERIAQIESTKASLKKALIVDDQDAIANAKKEIAIRQSDLKKFILMDFGPLDSSRFAKGQIGTLSDHWIEVIVITDLEKGHAVGAESQTRKLKVGESGIFFKLIGIDSARLDPIKRKKRNSLVLKKDEKFYVGDTTDGPYPGGKQKIFQLYAIRPSDGFTDEELKLANSSSDPGFTIALTEKEQAESRKSQESNKAKGDQKELDTNSRKAKSFLESGKVLMKKDNRAAAKKQFEKAIEIAPDSDAGKEATKLLDELP